MGLRIDGLRIVGSKIGRGPALGVVAACLMLGGCAFISGAEGPPDTYDLPVTPVARSKGGGLGSQLSVQMPVAIRSLDTDHIQVRDPAGRIAYYPAAVWGDRLPRLVQARLVASLEDAGRFRAITSGNEGLSADYGLAIEIRSFEVRVQPGSAQAVVDVYAKLVNAQRNESVASRQFTAEVSVGRDDVAAGVAALRQAFQQVTTDVVRWTSSARMADKLQGESRS